VIYLSVLSKNQTIAIQRGQTNTTLITIGARESTFKAKNHHCPLKSYTNTNKPRQKLFRVTAKLVGLVLLKSNFQRFH